LQVALEEGEQLVLSEGWQSNAQYLSPVGVFKAHCGVAPLQPEGASGQVEVQLGEQIAPDTPETVTFISPDEQEPLNGFSQSSEGPGGGVGPGGGALPATG